MWECEGQTGDQGRSPGVSGLTGSLVLSVWADLDP